MADENNASFPQAREGGGGAGRGGRPGGPREGGGNREAGGFRIRLSDNELKAVRAIQDAFNLRSTVAALGFSVRTLAQMLEDGKLDALVAEQRAQGGGRPEGRREGRRGEGRGDGRPERGGQGGRVNPFARPQKPAPAPAPASEDVGSEAPGSLDDPGADEAASSAEEAAVIVTDGTDDAPVGSEA